MEVYARAHSVELLVNGRSVGKKELKNDCIAKFRCIYEDGTIEAVSYDAAGKELGRCSLRTAAPETQLRAVSEENAVAPGRLCHIRLQYTDESGILKPLERGILNVEVSGGKLLGLGSACPYNEIGFCGTRTDTYYGEALAVVQANGGGELTLTVTDGRYTGKAVVPVLPDGGDESMKKRADGFWSTPLTSSLVKSPEVKLPEMLLSYFIGPFGALLSSGIFTSILQNYFTDVLKLDLSFLTGLQLFSTILIVAANLIVGQLIERTHALAGKARPWVLLSALTLSVASVLMFIVPFQNPTAKMVWIAVAYNLYYAVAYPIYNTANSTLIPVSTRDSRQRAALASFTNVAGLGVMGVGSMVFPMLVSFALKENQGLWFITMLAVALFTALTIFLQFKFTRERVTEESIGAANSAAQLGPPLWGNSSRPSPARNGGGPSSFSTWCSSGAEL